MGQENEKYFIGRELHDNIAQLLVGTKLSLSMIKGSSDKEKEWLKETKENLDDAIKELRSLSHNLAPSSFKSDNFLTTVEGLLKSINKENRFKITVSYDQLDQANLNSELKLNLYRILQEQLQNIIKHSDATKIEVGLRITENIIKLSIFDNGKGFDKKRTFDGIGLQNIKTRSETFKGICNINTSPGKGCEVTVRIPI